MNDNNNIIIVIIRIIIIIIIIIITRGNHRLKSAFDMRSELFPGRP